ncbi:hypothetical protein MRX96_026855 [Rhipicephalus microplus]
MPEIHSAHWKIIVRPRYGLDLRKTSCYGIPTATFKAAGIMVIQACTDLVCANVVENIVVVYTENEDNDRKTLALKNHRVNGKEHEEVMYTDSEGNYSQRRATWAVFKCTAAALHHRTWFHASRQREMGLKREE